MLGNLGTYICTCHTGGRRGRKLHVGVACTETGVAAGFSISFSPYSEWCVSHADHMHAGHYLESILKEGIVFGNWLAMIVTALLPHPLNEMW